MIGDTSEMVDQKVKKALDRCLVNRESRNRQGEGRQGLEDASSHTAARGPRIVRVRSRTGSHPSLE